VKHVDFRSEALAYHSGESRRLRLREA
jgi:hypothetical protein